MAITNESRSIGRRFTATAVAFLVAAAVPPASALTVPVADLRADTDRDGRVSVRPHAADDRGEGRWRNTRGAIVVANVDDDAGRCGTEAMRAQSDEVLAGCNDAADEIVNGTEDERDLAALRTVPWPAAPRDATGVVELLDPEAPARLYVRRDGEWQSARRATRLSARELRRGAVLALEATDVVRDVRAWDGRIRVRLTVASGRREAVDTVEVKTAPVIVQPETFDAQQIVTAPSAEPDRLAWVERARSAVAGAPLSVDERRSFEEQMERLVGPELWGFRALAAEQTASQEQFLAELDVALDGVGLTARRLDMSGDIWAQDVFEPGFAAMPGRGGRPHVMRVLVRSANAMRNGDVLAQRGGGRAVFTQLRGAGVGAVQQLTPGRALLPFVGVAEDTVNSTGNFTATPPYRTSTRRFPVGRLLYGAAPGSQPDPAFVRLLVDQGVQPPIELDTSWLEIGHVDEFVAFLPATTKRAWVAVVADPAYARRLLHEAQEADPDATILDGLQQVFQVGFVPSATPATRRVADVLADAAMTAANERASAAIERNLDVLRAEMALGTDDVVRIPVLYGPLPLTQRGGVAALIPNGVNGLHARDLLFVAPRQHGPRIGGEDLFARAIEHELARVGVRVAWAETYYHASGAGVGGGEVHCTTNALRDVRSLAAWWQRP